MIIGVLKETASGERRVALVPQIAKKFAGKGLNLLIESGAGQEAGFSDEDYAGDNIRVVPSAAEVLSESNVLLKVQEPTIEEAKQLNDSATLISMIFPSSNPDLVRTLQDRKLTVFAMELMPRITRAQAMDVLSSMSSIAGYKAVILAADLLPRYFPMLVTAAGTIAPARVLVLGAGVAGLQAIATAKRLGAVVEAFDIRPVVKEQVESLGARFVELEVDTSGAQDAGGYAKEQGEDTQEKIRELLTKHVSRADAVITTALIPGRKAPVLVTADMVQGMRAGSVVIDLAAEQGGNCEGSKPGETVNVNGVQIAGPLDLVSSVAVHASELYSKNISAFLEHLLNEEGELHLDLEDELTRGPLLTRDGEIVHEPTKSLLQSEGKES